MSDTEVIAANMMKIVKMERYDVNAMEGLASHDGISVDVKKMLKAYRRMRTDGNMVQVVYEYGKKLKALEMGRLYPQKGLGLQSFPSDVRAALASKYSHDIDAVNSQPVILVQLCKKNGWVCKELTEYVEKRSTKLSEIMDALGCDRDEAKNICIATLFGGKVYKKGIPEFIKKLSDEMLSIGLNIVKTYPTVFKACKGLNNEIASCVANVLQDIEFKILQCVDRSFQEKGRDMTTYIHDGGLVTRIDDKPFPSDILQYAEEQIVKEFGYVITLSEKPMVHNFTFKNDLMRGGFKEKEYQQIKEEFEENHFYCIETGTICKIISDGLVHITRSDANASFASYNFQNTVDNKLKVTEFIPEWLKDPSKNIIDKLGFYPDNKVPDDTYNLYNGMQGEQCDEKSGEDDAILECFKTLLYHNAGKNDKMNEYMLKWFAMLVQFPAKTPNVAIVLINTDQGTGKETLMNFIGSKVVGHSYYKNIKNVETELFDTHSTAFDKTLFMKLEEVNGTINRKFSDMLKAMITSVTCTINPKRMNKYTTNAFPHIVMTTNNAVPVKVEPGDRRFCVSYTSSDFKGNTEFWNDTYRLLELPDAGFIVYHYLKSIDLTGFNSSEFPRTEYHNQLSESETPSEVAFITASDPFEKLSATALHRLYIQWCQEQGIAPKSMVHFGRCLAPLIERNVIIRKVTKIFTVYSKK